MSSDGWIKLHRKIQDNPLWTCEKFTRGQAWVDLLLLANHSDSFFYKRGVKIEVKRGQLARSEVELSDRWQWSRTKVKKFLNDLKKEQQIGQQKSNITQIVTILNYEEYQGKEQQTLQQKSSKSAAEKHIQECKEGKECKEVKDITTAEQKTFATDLVRIVSSRREIAITPKQHLSWANTIRLMMDRDNISQIELTRVLSWYEKNWMNDFVPVIESAASLREKWSKLLNAIEREKKTVKGDTNNGFSERDYKSGATKQEDLPAFLR